MFLVSSALWALTDDRAGHTAHTLGLADALGLDYEQKTLNFNALSRVPQAFSGASLRSLDAASRARISAPWPSLVIASGRRMVPIMRYIKQQSPKTKLIQCLWPGQLEPFDVIAAPMHDALPDDARIFPYQAALHGLTQQALDDAALTFHALFDKLPKPHFGVMIGGHSGGRKAKLDDLHHLLDTAEFLAKEGSLIITTSRRTPRAFIDAIRDRLTCPYHLHAWDSGMSNPYRGILALSDAVIVSGDSLSMVAEACYTGKPVLVDITFHSMRDKHHRCCEELFFGDYATRLRADLDVFSLQPKRLDEVTRIAPLIKEYLAF